MIALQSLVRDRASDGGMVWLSLGDDVFLGSLCEGVCLCCVYRNLPAALALLRVSGFFMQVNCSREL